MNKLSWAITSSWGWYLFKAEEVPYDHGIDDLGNYRNCPNFRASHPRGEDYE